MKALRKFLWLFSLSTAVLFTGAFAACGAMLTPTSSVEEPVQITAVYEQSTQVFADTPLDDLKADLTVFLEMSDEDNEEESAGNIIEPDEYTLSGTLAVGESEITVTYNDVPSLKTEFSVTVSEGYAHEHTFTDYVSDNNATCEEDGTKTAKCDYEFCQATDVIVDEGSALSHAFENYVSDNNATCETNGTKTAECENGCGETKTVVDKTSKKGHVFENYVSNNDATCTEDGTKTAECENGCGETKTVVDVGSKLPHVFEDYVSNNDATCTEDGTKTGACIYGCGETETIADVGSKLPHVFENYASNGDATCQADGTKTASCKYGCGETHTMADEGTIVDHAFENYVSDNNATCTQDGTKTGVCKYACGETDTVTDVDSKVRHVFENYVSDGNATCLADGTKTAICERENCEEEDTVEDVGSALGHSYTNYVSNNDATCTEDGTKTATCEHENCEETATLPDEDSALGHLFKDYISNNDAELGKDGTKTATCERENCEETDTIQDVGSALEHNYTNYVSNNDATCTEDGTKTAECDNGCGTRKTVKDEGSALGHSYIHYVSNNDATCTEDGTKTATCEREGCEEKDTIQDVGSALGHSHTAVVTAPTCTAQGFTTHTCHCGDSYVDTYVDALGHKFTNYVSDGNATCEEDGMKTATCDNGCGKTETITDVGSKLPHVFENYVSNGDATCQVNGTKTASCEYGCGETSTVEDENSTVDHEFENHVSNGDATCTQDGTKTGTCKYGCGEEETIQDEGSALGHSFHSGVCERCSETNQLSIVTMPTLTGVYYGEQVTLTDGVVQDGFGETVSSGTWSISGANYSASSTSKEMTAKATLTFTPAGTEYAPVSKEIDVTLIAVAKYGNYYYATIDGALEKANASNSGTVYSLPLEDEIDSGRAKLAKTITIVTEIKSGVTFTLPYAENALDKKYAYVLTTDNSEYKQTSYGKTTYRKNQIYIAQDHTLTSAGTINVAGEVCGGAYMNYNTSTNANSITAGRHAQINLGANAKLISTGTVNCYGFISEETQNNGSEFIAQSGKVTVMFSIVEYRGAQRYFGMIDPSNSTVKQELTSAIKDGISSKSQYTPDTLQASPFNRFYIESVTAQTTVKYDAKMIGHVALFADADTQETTMNVINNSNGIITLTQQGGYVTYKYDYTTRKTDLDVYGNMTLNPLELKLTVEKGKYGINTTVELTLTTGATGDSDGVFFPISDLFDISLNALNGSATVDASNQKVKLLPGAKLTIGEGVVVNANEIAVYENNDLFANGADKHYTTNTRGQLIVCGTLNVEKIGGMVKVGGENASLNVSSSLSVISKEIKTMGPSATVEIKINILVSENLQYVNIDYTTEEESTLVAMNANGALLRGNEFFARNGKWVSNIVYVELELNGGTASMVNQEFNNGYVLNSAAVPTPTRTDHLFMGWYTTENFEDGTEFTDTLELTDDVTLYAKWVSNVIRVNLALNGGTGSTSVGPYTYQYEIAASELPAPTRPDYNFMGWYTTQNCVSGTEFTALTLTEDITVYAKWELKEGTIIVQFDTTSTVADDIAKTATFAIQTIGEASKTATYPAEAIACNEDISYARYVSGYYADKKCTVPFDFSQEITQDTTIYVKWAKKISVNISTGINQASKLVVNGKEADKIIKPFYVVPGAEVTLTTTTVSGKQANIEVSYTKDGEKVITNFTGANSATATITVELSTGIRITFA